MSLANNEVLMKQEKKVKYTPKAANNKASVQNIISYVILVILSVLFVFPTLVVLMNSFKGKLYISEQPFVFVNSDTFVGLENYVAGIQKTDFLAACGWSLFITIGSYEKHFKPHTFAISEHITS